jgi:hypothetical protein
MIAANVLAIIECYTGLGRHDNDPFLNAAQKRQSNQLNFASAVINMFSMFFVKLSASIYIMSLNFSKTYRAIVWVTIGIVIIGDLIIPDFIHWTLCRPLALRWDPRVHGSCWPVRVRLAGAYTQAVANIITDILYCIAPIVYLRRVQLSRRTQWGVRIVFLFALT